MVSAPFPIVNPGIIVAATVKKKKKAEKEDKPVKKINKFRKAAQQKDVPAYSKIIMKRCRDRCHHIIHTDNIDLI